jgi:hypothetical protein
MGTQRRSLVQNGVFGLAGAAIMALAMIGGTPGPQVWAQMPEFGWPLRSEPASEQPSRVGCLVADTPVVDRVSSSILRYCGPITALGVQMVREGLDGRVRTLSISSLGGGLDAPLDLADLVRELRLEVLVDGPCLSGCASFVFVAAENRRVAQGALLGVHNTANSATFLAMGTFGALAATDDPLLERARREFNIYSRAGVSQYLLLEPQARINPLCVGIGAANPESGETVYELVTEQAIWFPTRQQWEEYGVDFTGYAPRSASDVEVAMAGSFPEGGQSVSYVFTAEGAREPWWYRLLRTPACD